MMIQKFLIVFGLLLPWSNGFQNVGVRRNILTSRDSAGSFDSLMSSELQGLLHHEQLDSDRSRRSRYSVNQISSLFRRPRFNTIRASGLKNVNTAGAGVFMFGINTAKKLAKKVKTLPEDVRNMTWSDVKPKQRIKKLHGPKFYLLMNVVLAGKYPKILDNLVYWLWFAFCIKWYRARYVFKIPVWDRQPNWNNVITSKEQEKDLKALTCTKCGSTLFIAKSREFFFEGSTGIGGLGCFACGVKGKEYFVEDRERIVQNVADIDDYFEYERPLDFLSAAERRKMLKETGGDEDAANQLLVERDAAPSTEESQAAADAVVNGATGTMDVDNDVVSSNEAESESDSESESSKAEEEDINGISDSVSSFDAETKVTKPTPSSADVDEVNPDDSDADKA